MESLEAGEEEEMIYHNPKNKRNMLEKQERKIQDLYVPVQCQRKRKCSKKGGNRIWLNSLFCLPHSGSIIAPFPTGNISNQVFIILPSTLSFQSVATQVSIFLFSFLISMSIYHWWTALLSSV